MKDARVEVPAVPAKTIERLVIYRTLLEEMKARDRAHVFSKEMAQIAGNTAAQVRRDVMSVGHAGNTRNGYRVEELVKAINVLLEPPDGITMAIAGIGNLGRALLGYFSLLQPRFRIVAAFDSDANKVDRMISGYRIRHTRDMAATLADAPPQIGIVTVPADHAQKITDAFVQSQVRGIVNFAPAPLRVPHGIWLENMHITATIEKVAHFSRMNAQGDRQ